MLQSSLNAELNKLFDTLRNYIEQSELKIYKKIKVPSELFLKIYSMNGNNRSKLFLDTAGWVDPAISNNLLAQRLIKRVLIDNREKYALTLKGIAYCISLRYNKPLEMQFEDFLEASEQIFFKEQDALFWTDKLASLSLILLISTSKTSAIKLNNESNKSVFSEVIEKTLDCMKKCKIIPKKRRLSKIVRGETPVSALMSRCTTLARKTNHYYQNIKNESGYYFDLEKNGALQETRLLYLFRKIFEGYDHEYDSDELYSELMSISQLYYPRFLSRSVTAHIAFAVLKELKDFFDTELFQLRSHH